MSKAIQTSATKPAQTSAPSTKDTGVVHVGGGAMRFASVIDTGTVHVGGGAMRFKAVRDNGKVHIGGGAMRF